MQIPLLPARRGAWLSLALSPFLLAGCGGSAPFTQGTGAAPQVSAVAVQVNGNAPNRMQEIQFNEAMDAATINTQTFQVLDSNGNPMPGLVTYNPAFEIASFQPSPPLQANTAYKATLSTAVASAAGVHLANPYSYTFTTRDTTDASPISVRAVSPAAGATCVSQTTLIMVTFDESPDAATVTPANFMVTGPNGASIPVKLSMNATTTQVVLTPVAPLPAGSITVTVNNVSDLANVPMKGPYTWSFSTACTSGGGGTGGGTAQYDAPLFPDNGQNTQNGHISVDQSGNTTIQLTGATAGATYTVQFCPVVTPTGPQTACFNVTSLTADAAGNATVTAKFPRAGDWAGDFNINNAAGKGAFDTFLAYNAANQSYLSTLLPFASLGSGSASPNPSSYGTVVYSNNSLVFSLKGGAPNTLYSTSESETYFLDGSGTYGLTTFTSDAHGDGSSSTQLNPPGGDIFQVDSNSGSEFIGGFAVPN